MASKSYENPLMPHARMREMYEAMAAARRLASLPRARGSKPLGRNLEACWAGTGIGLRDVETDRFSAGAAGPVPDLVAGLPLRQVLAGKPSAQRLEMDAVGMERMLFLLGWSTGKTAGSARDQVTLIYVHPGELTAADWKRVLTEALRRELPIVFITLPGKQPGIAELSTRLGVPGIPVDAADAIALYRVTQECIGRARTGGGPALIEPVVFPATGDPIALLARQLISRRVVTERWIRATDERLARRIPPSA